MRLLKQIGTFVATLPLIIIYAIALWVGSKRNNNN